MNLDKAEISIPVVATRGIVIFPNQDLTIEVGRIKSLNAIEEANQYFDGHVWLVSQKDVMVDNPKADDLFTVGTLCRIKQVKEKNGFKTVRFGGLERAQLVHLSDDERMLFSTIKLIHDYSKDSQEEIVLVKRLAKEFENIAMRNLEIPKSVIEQLAKGVSAPALADQVAQLLPMSYDKKQMLLEMLDINQRLMVLIQEMATQKELADIEKSINERVNEKIQDSQKEYYLREKLRAIKEELGDVSSVDDDSEGLRARIQNNPYPQRVKDKALEELKRYEMLPAASGEAGVIRSYLDWLLDVPWWQESEDNTDLNAVHAILEEDHYGLTKVKERIMEYLAVKTVTNSLKSPILCLVGPPGVGKTSLAKSIARALGRTFVKISLGGVRDEAEIRGHRRTYLGSLPGRFIQGMKRAKVINPVFLIDELDKMSSDYKGDPSSAMLEVLDPEQNSFFSDHYLEEPYDLSKVLFVATANYLENIPPALKDRLEIIQLPSYTEEEKLHIAKEHLVHRVCETNGLKDNQFKIDDNEIYHLIRRYTREAGVRQLERELSALCRKSILAIVKDNKKSVKITRKLIKEWLGKEPYDYGLKEKTNQVGVATGLAYTSFGGDVLPVEVTFFEGKGNLIVTGQLGDVMKESANIAFGFVKANAQRYHIDPKFFEKHDIHIHIPEGAVPKDGPSAGITLTTALISSLTQHPVYADLAMTGEVTLRGNVLPIGGLREKTMAAYRSGITKVLIPKQNLRDVDELPAVVKESIKIVPVETMEQVLNNALVP
ncbi:MAG: endopeptidase La [Erysipelotrichaceae bacterium]|jgi:ATP-dependent Lon protease|nr:endopeptidase La [Erysipelotrichaceae bacterium]